jgi:hypothetical protein
MARFGAALPARQAVNYAGKLAASAQTHGVKGGFIWNF